MGDRLTILFTNIWLHHYAGSEVVTRDLALGALRRGHRPIVYTPTIGPFADELTARGIAVVDDLRMLAEVPDVIHAHHVIPCAEAIIRFPETPAIYVCHGFAHWLGAAAHFPQIGAYVAVDEACRDRLVHTEGIEPGRVVMLPNAVDLSRIPSRPRPLAERPRRAVAFGKASSVSEIRAACDAMGIEFEAIGLHAGREVPDPERHLVQFDLVFASARAALEALCCGCAVVACDFRGCGGLVTSESYPALRASNFGLRALTAPLSVERLIAEVRRYDPDDARRVGERARGEADLARLLDAFEGIYTRVISAARSSPVPRQSHEAAVARFLHAYLPRRPDDPRWPWLAERQAMFERIAELESQLAAERNASDERAAELMGERNAYAERIRRLESELAEREHAGLAGAEAVAKAAAELEETRDHLSGAEHRLAAIKRSRLLKLGRWLRRIRGMPLPY